MFFFLKHARIYRYDNSFDMIQRQFSDKYRPFKSLESSQPEIQKNVKQSVNFKIITWFEMDTDAERQCGHIYSKEWVEKKNMSVLQFIYNCPKGIETPATGHKLSWYYSEADTVNIKSLLPTYLSKFISETRGQF